MPKQSHFGHSNKHYKRHCYHDQRDAIDKAMQFGPGTLGIPVYERAKKRRAAYQSH